VRSTETGIRTARPRAPRLARERSDTGAREPEALGLSQSGDAGSGTETGLDRECPGEPEDDGEERKLYSLEAVRGFHRFDFSSLAAVAFFSVFLEPLRNGGRARGPEVLVRSVVVDKVRGFPIVAQLLRELAVPCPTRAPMLSARAGRGRADECLLLETVSLSRDA
jgi:hypothetical protein